MERRERLAPPEPAELMGEQPRADGGRDSDREIFQHGMHGFLLSRDARQPHSGQTRSEA